MKYRTQTGSVDVNGTSFSRDLNSKAIIEQDKKKMLEYKNKRTILKKQHTTEEKINKLEQDLDEIKSLLRKVLESNVIQ